MKSGRKIENWSQKVSQTLKAWVLSQIKPLISHLNEIIESYDTKMIRLIHFTSHSLIEIHIAFFIQNWFHVLGYFNFSKLKYQIYLFIRTVYGQMIQTLDNFIPRAP